MGLPEAIPDAEILSRARTSPDAGGVKGSANFAYDSETGAVRVGRYGWKASKVSLRHQVAGTALLDMSVTSPIAGLDADPQKVKAGAKLFADIKCSSCHGMEVKTGSGGELAEARNQTIRPYTDMLLHDMWPDLADGMVEGQDTGSMWRTSPLWGVGYTELVAGKNIKMGYLHDSRARNLTEAILWRGGEAVRSRQRFPALSAADRAALLAFLGSL